MLKRIYATITLNTRVENFKYVFHYIINLIEIGFSKPFDYVVFILTSLIRGLTVVNLRKKKYIQ
jgi:hypothetical protein